LHHVKAVETGFEEMAIAQTARTSSAGRLASCAECHASDGSIPPSDPEFARLQATTLTFSPCAKATPNGFDCSTCHDPHRPVATETSHYEARCLSCHPAGEARAERPPHANPEPAPKGKAPVCPVNPAAGCIGCHMPKVEDAMPHTVFTDHHIRVHREAVRSQRAKADPVAAPPSLPPDSDR
jgi:hypothetical protein